VAVEDTGYRSPRARWVLIPTWIERVGVQSPRHGTARPTKSRDRSVCQSSNQGVLMRVDCHQPPAGPCLARMGLEKRQVTKMIAAHTHQERTRLPRIFEVLVSDSWPCSSDDLPYPAGSRNRSPPCPRTRFTLGIGYGGIIVENWPRARPDRLRAKACTGPAWTPLRSKGNAPDHTHQAP